MRGESIESDSHSYRNLTSVGQLRGTRDKGKAGIAVMIGGYFVLSVWTYHMVHAIQNVHEALKLVLHVAMLVLMPSQILNLYLR